MATCGIEIWGICGGSGSGKTTLATQLHDRLGDDRVVTIAHDAYYRDLSHLDPAQREAVNYDHPDALETELLLDHLAELRAGRAIDAPVYDFAVHNRASHTRRIDPRPLVLIDGILILAVAELREAFDLRVFLDVPDDVRLARRMARDVSDRGRHPDAVTENFLSVVLPMHLDHVAPHRSAAEWVIPHRHDRKQWLDRLCGLAPPAWPRRRRP